MVVIVNIVAVLLSARHATVHTCWKMVLVCAMVVLVLVFRLGRVVHFLARQMNTTMRQLWSVLSVIKNISIVVVVIRMDVLHVILVSFCILILVQVYHLV